MLVVNGANVKKDWDWLNKNNKWGNSVELVNKSDEYSLLAV